MDILIVGGGGREHALAWRAAQSAGVNRVYVAPGNAGTAVEDKISNIAIAADDIDALLAFSQDKSIDLTIVGPEAPLVAGIVDVFNAANLACFGPGAAAAQLEGSKAFCKDFLQRHNIPTAAWETHSDIEQAISCIERMGAPVVVKADGLAAGKGVVVAQTVTEAVAAVTGMLAENRFGDAGHRVIIEEFLAGEEASFIVMCDGEHILPFAGSQDHKARDNGDRGPNTGGMGACSPAPVIDARLHDRIMQEIVTPTVAGMQADGIPYSGFLYAGLMIDADCNPSVLEFNCRFGDPETQPVMMRFRGDLVKLCKLALSRQLHRAEIDWDDRVAVAVVMASAGYPEGSSKGDVISGLDSDFGRDTKVFHAATALENDRVLTNGGRVLGVTSLGSSFSQAQANAYLAVDHIQGNGLFYRTDIGHRAIRHESK